MSGEPYLRAHPPIVDTRAAGINAAAAAVRLTAGQRRAALDVLLNRGSYASMELLADAIALAVMTAEDEASRQVVAVLEPGGAFYVFGPYATRAAADKAVASGLATRDGARGGVFPLIPAPRAAKADAATKKAASQRRAKSKADTTREAA